jgi:hypothetical protein
MGQIWPAHYVGWAWLLVTKNRGGCSSWRLGWLVVVPISNPTVVIVREAALARHHQEGIPFWSSGKDSHRRRWPMVVHDVEKWTPWRKWWSGGCEGWSGQ